MANIFGYHEGNRSELLAGFGLSSIGYVVPVPRQFDRFFVDLIVWFFRSEPKVLLSTSLTANFQIKSNNDDIEILGEDAREVFFRSGSPLFVGVVEKATMTFSIYTTIHRLFSAWTKRERDLVLRFDEGEWPPTDQAEPVLYLGPPVVKISIFNLNHANEEVQKKELLRFRKLLLWVMLEQMVISWRIDNLPWVSLPKAISTNEGFQWKELLYHVVPDVQISEACLTMIKSIEAFRDYLTWFDAADKVQTMSSEESGLLLRAGKNMSAIGALIDEQLQQDEEDP